ncbi:MAG: carbohydrate deacetylase [Candidatus Hodarchaeota archaeon]
MKIFYHCDDMGSTPRITQRILDACQSGLIDSFSIMANGDGIDEMVAGLKELQKRDIRIAVHLNLTEGKALSPKERVPLLTNSKGSLKFGFSGLLLRWLCSSRSKKNRLIEQIEREWQAQFAKTKELCQPRKVSSVDSHLHIHMLPFLFPIAAQLARQNGIPNIRISREPFHLSSHLGDSLSLGFILNIIKHIILRILSREVQKTLMKYGLKTSPFIVGVLYTGLMTKEAVRVGIASAYKKGADTVEVIFHIGRATKEEVGRWEGYPSIAAFSMRERRDKEFEELNRLRSEK